MENLKRGGSLKLPKMPKTSRKGTLSKSYSKSLEATNRLFTENALFEKPKSRKRKIFDPNAKYAEGGDTTPEEWQKAIRNIEQQIGSPDQWTLESYNLLQNKLNEYKNWRENIPEGQAVRDSHNVEGEYNVPLPQHLQNYTNGMMKARLAYANEFGNAAAKRMIVAPDQPYDFGNGVTGTHYMASIDNYAVPQIQDVNGQLMLGDYGPESTEAIKFDRPADAEYFAAHYKDISPAFLNQKAEGGTFGCPPGYTKVNGQCKKINAFVTSDPDEYAFRKAAYDDSLWLHQNNLKPLNNKGIMSYGISKDFLKKYDVITNKGSAKDLGKIYEKIKKNYPHTLDKFRDAKSTSPYENQTQLLAEKLGIDHPTTDYDHLDYAMGRFRDLGVPNPITGNIIKSFDIPLRSDASRNWRLDVAARYKKPVQPVLFKEETKPTRKTYPPRLKKPVAYVNPPVEERIPIEQPQPPIQDNYPPPPPPAGGFPPGPPPPPPYHGVEPFIQGDPIPEYATPDRDAQWVAQKERYIDWNGNNISYKLPRFRKPGHSGPLVKGSRTHYLRYPSIETRNSADIIPEEEEFAMGGQYIEAELTDKEIDEYRKGGFIVEDISVPTLNQYPNGGERRARKLRFVKGSEEAKQYPESEWAQYILEQPEVSVRKPSPERLAEIQREIEQEQSDSWKMGNNFSYETLGPQSVQSSDWLWQLGMTAPTALKGLGALASLEIPGTGVSLGTAANTVFGIHGASQIPNRVEDWQNVAAGKKDWREATAESLMTGLELYGGYGAAKELLPQAYKINPFALKELPGSPNSVDETLKSGFDGNFLTRPLTPFTKNELTNIPNKNLKYRKIGNKKGLQDLIDKGGAQAPAPMRMKSGLTADTPFFGMGKKPSEDYKGLFAVELKPNNSNYTWSSRVAGTDNYGVAPFDKVTGRSIKNVPLEDLNVYRKKFLSNNYRKLDPNNLEEGLKYANAQQYAENAYKWGARGLAADQLFNEGAYRKKLQDIISNNFIDYKQEGGEHFELDLTPEQIQEYAKNGFIVEEIFEPTLNQYPNGGEPKGRRKDRFVPGTYDPNETAGYELTEQEVNVPVKASNWGKAAMNYENRNPEEQFIEKKKKQYLRKNKGLNEFYGVDMQNFPKDVEANFRKEYDYKKNTAVVKKVGRQEGWNPNKRTDYVDDLNDTQRGIVAESKYGSKLQPTYWSRTLAGLGTLASKFSPEVRDAMNKGYMPGLTKKESQEILNSKMTKVPFTNVDLPFAIPTGGLESLAGLEIPGVLPANYVKNTGLTTGSNYKEMPSWYNGEKMANVKDKDVTAFNPVTYAGLEKLPEVGVKALQSGYNGLRSGYKLATELNDASKAANISNLFSEGANTARNLQEAGLLGKDVDPKLFGKFPGLGETATKAALKKYNTSYRAVTPDITKASMDELMNMAKSGVTNFDDPVQVAQYMSTHIPMESYGYRANALTPGVGQDLLYTGKYPNAEIAAKNLKGYGTHLTEVRPSMDFSSGSTADWFKKYYKDKAFGIDDAGEIATQFKKEGDWLSGFNSGTISGKRNFQYWPYIGNKGERILDPIRTIELPPKEVPQFKSEINWANWNPDTPNYPELINEYNAIEETTKANRTWMRNPDGTKYKGTPEQFIQEQSSYYKKAYPEGTDITYRGVTPSTSKHDLTSPGQGLGTPNRSIFTSNKDLASGYASTGSRSKILSSTDAEGTPGVFELMHKKGNQIDHNTQLDHWLEVNLGKSMSKPNLIARIAEKERHLEKLRGIENVEPALINGTEDVINMLKNYLNNYDDIRTNHEAMAAMRRDLGDVTSTNDIAEYLPGTDIDKIKLRNIDDGGYGDVTIVNSRPGNYMKSRVGNVGFFDLNNPNIYKMAIPGIVGGSLMYGKQKDGGMVLELSDKEIEEYKKGGWIVEEM